MQVQEFEHINGCYSMPELIRRPCEPVRSATNAAGTPATTSANAAADGETPKSTTTSTSATPATSAAASPAPGGQDTTEKDKEVITYSL